MIEGNSLHVFDNGIKVFKKHLIPLQVERYKAINLHEPEEEEWFRKIIPILKQMTCPVFVDIGSAIGYYSILMKLNIPECRIICYEPLKIHREYMAANWKLNGLNPEQVLVKSDAVYSQKGKLVFKEHFFGSQIENKKKDFKKTLRDVFSFSTRSKVNAVLLDHEIVSYGQISLLKIDVQGAEIEVLKGAFTSLKDQLIKCLIIGTHSADIHNECLTILKKFNYNIAFENLETKLQPDGIVIATSKDFSLA